MIIDLSQEEVNVLSEILVFVEAAIFAKRRPEETEETYWRRVSRQLHIADGLRQRLQHGS